MSKPLITLDDTTTLVNDFNKYLNGSNVPFVVLGNTADHQDLAKQAANLADAFDLAIYVPEPAGLYATLLTFKTDACSLPATYDPAGLFAVSIAADDTICYVMTTHDPASIALAFMSAETH